MRLLIPAALAAGLLVATACQSAAVRGTQGGWLTATTPLDDEPQLEEVHGV